MGDSSGTGTSWIVPPTTALRWREWDGQFVVFNPSSGDTHFLNTVAGTVLQYLEPEPRTMADVVKHIETLSEAPLDAGAVAHIDELIVKFDTAGLIEPYHP